MTAKIPASQIPTVHCDATTKRRHMPCTQKAGHRTNHQGYGRCWLHGGRAPGGIAFGKRGERYHEAINNFAALSLAQIADKLARLAAAGAVSVTAEDHDDFLRAVTAFARAAERAEGSKVSIETKVSFLAELSDEELDRAIAEAERIVAEAKATKK